MVNDLSQVPVWLEPAIGDCPEFIALMNRHVADTVANMRPQDVYLTKVDHWFDHKWFAFGGTVLGKLSDHKLDPLRVPPFVPSRVMSQRSFRLRKNRSTYEEWTAPPLHREQSSDENRTNLLCQHSGSGIFVWYSGDTAQSDQGCLMVYYAEVEVSNGWYASFLKMELGSWKVNKTKMIPRSFLEPVMLGTLN